MTCVGNELAGVVGSMTCVGNELAGVVGNMTCVLLQIYC